MHICFKQIIFLSYKDCTLAPESQPTSHHFGVNPLGHRPSTYKFRPLEGPTLKTYQKPQKEAKDHFPSHPF